MSRQLLENAIRNLRRRAMLLASGVGLARGLALALIAWIVFLWLDLVWVLSPEVRIAGNAVAATAALLLFGSLIWRTARYCNDDRLARILDSSSASAGELVSGFDLARHAPSPADQSITAGLAAMAIERAGVLAARVSPSQAIAARPVAAASAGLGAVVVLIALIAAVAPRMALTQWLRFSDPYGDHPPYSSLRFKVEPGDAEVVYGGSFEVTAAADGPTVERIELVIQERDERGQPGEAQVLPMFPEGSGSYRAMLTQVTAPAEYYVRSGRARSTRFDLDVITVPRLQEVRVRIAPPAYTRRPAYDGPLPAEGIVALPGAEVRFTAKSNRPLRSGTVSIDTKTGREQVALDVSGEGHEVRGTHTVSAAGKFQLLVTDVDGRDSQDRLTGSISLIADEKPFVRMLQPGPQSLATPNVAVPVALVGEDDYGVARLDLYRSLNDSRALPLELETPRPEVPRVDGNQSLPLSTYGLQPGDVIKLYGRVEDNDPAGNKGSESPIVEVRIISQEEFERMVRIREGLQVLTSKYRAAQRRLEAQREEDRKQIKRLKDDDDEKVKDKPANDADRRELKQLAESLARDAEGMREGLQRLLPYDLDRNLSQQLEKLANRLDEQSKALSDLADENKLSRKDIEKLLKKLSSQLDEDSEKFAAAALAPIEELERVFPLIEDQAVFERLVQAQRDLAERTKSLHGKNGDDNPALKARFRDLEEEQRKLREELAGLLDGIEDHASRLPDDEQYAKLRESAKQFVEAVRESGASEAMTDAELGLAEFSGTRGSENAIKAAELLEKLLAKSQPIRMQGKACLVFRPGMAEALGDTIDQLLAEMGLGSGSGQGGYSMRRSARNSPGLYGRLPGQEPSHGLSGRGDPGRGGSGDSRAAQPNEITSRRAIEAAGGSQIRIPPNYRSRVGAYSERITDERE